MKPFLPTVAVLAFALSACDEIAVTIPQSKPEAEYHPELSGTVDHVLCLLGFEAVAVNTLMTGHHVVDGRLNGKEARFVLDTGANISVIDHAHAKHFGLQAQRFTVGVAVGLGGGMQAQRARVTSLELGALNLHQKHVMIANLSQLTKTLGRLSDKPIHGIIGQDVLKGHRAVIDASKPMLYVQKYGAAPAPIAAERCADKAKAA